MAPKTAARRVSLACIPCRTRHVRCDAVRPNCMRCLADSTSCHYAESRRMGRPKLRTRQAATLTLAANYQHGGTTSQSSTEPVEDISSSHSSLGPGFMFMQSADPGGSAAFESLTCLGQTSGEDLETDGLLDLYYQFFHRAHPFVLPAEALRRKLAVEPGNLHHLEYTMQYVGSFYSQRSGNSDLLGTRACAAVAQVAQPDGFVVQTLLLMAIAKSMCNYHQESRQHLDQAIHNAKAIGMHTQAFAVANGDLDPILEESWRRTWWMLYITDANFAVIQRQFEFSLALNEQNVDLPCEEDKFQTNAVVPPPDTLAEYRNREYSLEEKSFSSFAYLIDATAIFNQLLLAAVHFRDSAHSESLCSDADASIAGWFLFLPKSKKELTKTGYFVDELLFQAHMMMHTQVTLFFVRIMTPLNQPRFSASVFIHRPLSALRYSSVESISTCAPPPPPQDPASPQSRLTELVHSVKVVEAIRKQNQCLLLPVPAVAHSPSIICMVACGTIAYLAACRFSLDDTEVGIARDRIRASMGMLKCFEDIWPRTRKILRELKVIARNLLSLDQTVDHLSTSQSQSAGSYPDPVSAFLLSSHNDDLEEFSRLEMPWNMLGNIEL